MPKWLLSYFAITVFACVVSPVQKLNNPCYMSMTMSGGSDLIPLHLSSDMMEGAAGVMDGEQLFTSLTVSRQCRPRRGCLLKSAITTN